jgi:hypothetical protein
VLLNLIIDELHTAVMEAVTVTLSGMLKSRDSEILRAGIDTLSEIIVHCELLHYPRP